MKDRAAVSVMIFTLNEEMHLAACLDALSWCDDVIVVDSFSSDRTQDIAEQRGARLFTRAFDGFGTQRNWALQHTAPRHEWVLILDADERVPPELAAELADKAGSAPPEVAAYRLRRRFHMWGRWLRHSSLYPSWVVRFVRLGRVRYVNRGHAETQEVDGVIDDLAHDLIDENLKGIDEWFERQNRYSTKEALHELGTGETVHWRALFSGDALQRRAALKAFAANLPGRALIYFLYTYIFRLGMLDGRAGLMFCLMRAMYQQMIQIKKFDMRRKNGGSLSLRPATRIAGGQIEQRKPNASTREIAEPADPDVPPHHR
jgi:glycosyltransferase involved in cell wall biosynthesis